MKNFEFHNPTRIVFGQGRIQELDRLVPAAARVLVLYGGGSVLANGTLAEARAALGGRFVRIIHQPRIRKVADGVGFGPEADLPAQERIDLVRRCNLFLAVEQAPDGVAFALDGQLVPHAIG